MIDPAKTLQLCADYHRFLDELRETNQFSDRPLNRVLTGEECNQLLQLTTELSNTASEWDIDHQPLTRLAAAALQGSQYVLIFDSDSMRDGFTVVGHRQRQWTCEIELQAIALIQAEAIRQGQIRYDKSQASPDSGVIEKLVAHVTGNQTATETNDDFFDAADLRSKYGFQAGTLSTGIKRGRIKLAEKRGGRWFYKLSELKKLYPQELLDD